MEEKTEERINIEDLPRAEQELTDAEANDVKGGLPAVQMVREAPSRAQSGNNTWNGNVILDSHS